LVGDVHWIDRASGDVLAFLARRLEFEPIVLVVSMRDGTPTPFADAGRATANWVRSLAEAGGRPSAGRTGSLR
jgi:hypothetical protein